MPAKRDFRAVPDISIVTTGHDVADARLHRHVEAFDGVGISVEIHGFGNRADAPPAAEHVTTRRRPGMVGRMRLGRALVRLARGRALISLDPDSAVACQRYRHPGVLHVADVHEDYVALLADRRWARGPAGVIGARIAQAGEQAARRADLTVVADEHLLPDAPRRLLVRNVPLVHAPVLMDAEPRAVYVGDLRTSRGLFDMLDVLAAAPGWSLDLVGPVDTADRALFDDRLGASNGRVRWHGRQPPARAWEIARGAWVGLSLLHDTPAFRDASPSKVYEYAANGMAAIVTDLPRQREIVEASRGGVVVGSTNEAAEQLRAWMASPKQVRALSAQGHTWASKDTTFSEGSARLAEAIATMLHD